MGMRDWIVAVALGSSVFIGCGGGGGGGGDGETAAKLTADNAVTAVSETIAAVNFVGEMDDLANIFLEISENGSSLAAAPLSRARPTEFGAAARMLESARVSRQAASATRGAAMSMDGELPCDAGGSMHITVTAANPEQWSTGDTIRAVLSDCKAPDPDVPGSVTTSSGTMSFELTRVTGTGTSPPFGMDVDVGLTDFQVSVGTGAMVKVTGSFTSSTDTTDGTHYQERAFGKSISMTETGPGISRAFELLDFDASSSSDVVAGEAALVAGGTLKTTSLGGFVTFGTVSAFVSQGDDYPHQGAMTITGAGNSTLTLRAVDATHAAIELDLNGDGVLDPSPPTNPISTSWDALLEL